MQVEAALRQSAICQWLATASDSDSDEASDPYVMLTQLDLGSSVSRQQHKTKGSKEKLLAELFLRPHSELTAFYSSLNENSNMESLCSSPVAGESFSESLHDKVGFMELRQGQSNMLHCRFAL